MSGLFAKPSAIDNEKIVAEKTRTIVQVKKKERKERKREEKRKIEQDVVAGEAEDKEEAEQEQEVEMEVDEAVNDVNDDDDDEALEDRYLAKLVESDESDESEDDGDDEDDKEEDENDENEREETKESTDKVSTETEYVQNSVENTVTAAKILDLKEKEFEKAERTVFIGNVPAVIMSNKRETKDFKHFINKFLNCPENTSLIESVRFRSIHSTTTAPRKVAFIAKEVDLENVMNAYVVLKTKEDSLKLLKMNGVVYKDHHLRVDHLAHPTKKDNKLSIFVGNLDFQEKEETLWKHFNNVLIEKKDKKQIKNVIDNVRIVRDPKTSFGKGFAIIQFIDSNWVTKALMQDGKKMGKRTLRITRCKKVMRNNQSMRNTFAKLNDKQKTVVGRAKQLGKIDRRSLGKIVIEGDRATKGSTVDGIGKKRHGGRKEKREKKARITKRSQSFKEKAKTTK